VFGEQAENTKGKDGKPISQKDQNDKMKEDPKYKAAVEADRKGIISGETKYTRGAGKAVTITKKKGKQRRAYDEGYFYPLRTWMQKQDPEAEKLYKSPKELWQYAKRTGIPVIKDDNGVWGVRSSELPSGAYKNIKTE